MTFLSQNKPHYAAQIIPDNGKPPLIAAFLVGFHRALNAAIILNVRRLPKLLRPVIGWDGVHGIAHRALQSADLRWGGRPLDVWTYR